MRSRCLIPEVIPRPRKWRLYPAGRKARRSEIASYAAPGYDVLIMGVWGRGGEGRYASPAASDHDDPLACDVDGGLSRSAPQGRAGARARVCMHARASVCWSERGGRKRAPSGTSFRETAPRIATVSRRGSQWVAPGPPSDKSIMKIPWLS
jgi:hypothetical protein